MYLHSILRQIFIAAVASVVIYSLIFLSLRGTLVVKGGLKIILDPEQRREFDQYHLFISSIAKTMLWYVDHHGSVAFTTD